MGAAANRVGLAEEQGARLSPSCHDATSAACGLNPVGSPPSVSVIIAAHNGAATLRDSLRSLQRQSLRDWETIVVDDGSTDSTAQIAQDWEKREPRVRAVTQAQAGVAAARNRGLGFARADWLLFLDCDDWLAPDALARLLAVSRNRPSAGVCLGRAVVELPSGQRLQHPRFDLADAFGFLCCEGRIAIHSAIVRRALVDELGGFDPALRSSEDWDLWQRLARTGAEFAQTDRVVAFYRNRPGSLSKDVLRVAKDGLVVLRRGHAADSRVRNPAPAHARGAPASSLADRELYWVAWCAARQIALGGEGQEVLRLLSQPPARYDAVSLGELLARGMADVLAVPPASLSARWPEFEPKLVRLLQALGNARQTAEAVAIIKARLNGARRKDADSLQLERGPAGGHRPGSPILQLRWGDRTMGAVAVPSLGEMNEATFVETVARGAALLPLRAAIGALPVSCAPRLIVNVARRLGPSVRRALPAGARRSDHEAWFRGALRNAVVGAIGDVVRSRFEPPEGVCGHASALSVRLDHWRGAAQSSATTSGVVRAGDDFAQDHRVTCSPRPRGGTATNVPVLMYHRIAPNGAAGLNRYRVDPAAFETQLRALRAGGFVSVSLPQLAASLRFERPLPARAVLFTFDDGYADFARYAWPIIQRYGFHAIVFAVAQKVGGAADWDTQYGEPEPLMDWRTLRGLAQAGLDVQSHGLTHTRLTDLDTPRIFDEALGSRALLETALGRAPIAFCYPYGARDLTAEQVLQACGFTLGVTTAPGFVTLGDPGMRMARVEVAGDDNLDAFRRKLHMNR